jgi:NADH-quinone oxidoreductase E subunit
LSLAPLAREFVARYPEGKSRSALLPLLRAAQERDGYVTRDAIGEIADILEISPAEVSGVASFYHMLKLRPKGRHVVSVCHNLACSLVGAESLIGALRSHLGIEPGETTADGEFTLERAECLAACDLAPMLQIDYDWMVGPLTPDDAVKLVRNIAAGTADGAPGPVIAIPPSRVPPTPPSPHPKMPLTTESPGAAERPDDAATDVEARFAPEEESFLVDTIALSEEEEEWMHPTSEDEKEGEA